MYLSSERVTQNLSGKCPRRPRFDFSENIGYDGRANFYMDNARKIESVAVPLPLQNAKGLFLLSLDLSIWDESCLHFNDIAQMSLLKSQIDKFHGWETNHIVAVKNCIPLRGLFNC